MKLTDERILSQIKAHRDKAREAQKELSDKREEFYRRYRAEPYGNERDGWSQTVLPVIWNICESSKPALVEIFTGDFFGITAVRKEVNEEQPAGVMGMPAQQQPEDLRPRDVARDIQEYIRHKLFCQMEGEQLMDDCIHYALTSHYGVVKVTHREEYEDKREDYESLSVEEFAMLAADPELSITKYDELTDGAGVVLGVENVKAVRRVLKYRGPWVEVIPPRELEYVPGYATLDQCPYVTHKTKRDLDYILRRERQGLYRKGVHAKLKAKIDGRVASPETETETQTLFSVDGLTAPESRNLASTDEKQTLGQNEVWVEEIYTRMDIDGDGLLEPVILTVCDDVVLRDPIENPYGGPPFELATILREPDKIIGRPIPELFDQWQRMMTNMVRAVQDSAMLSTARGWVTNNKQLQKALTSFKPGDAVVANDMQFRAELLDFGAPNQFILKAMEQTQYEIDKASGVNEAMQGLDKQAMNRTLGGMQLKLSASQERQRLIARRLARCWKRIIRRIIDIMRIWPPEDDVKVIGRDVQITEDDLRGEYMVEVDVGVGPVDKQTNAATMSNLVAFLTGPGLQLGIGTPDNVVMALRRQHEYLDVDVSDILPDAQKLAANQQHQQAMQQLQGLQQQLQQMQQENAKLQQAASKNSPELRQAEMQAEYQFKSQQLQQEMELKWRELQEKMALEWKKLEGQLQIAAAKSNAPVPAQDGGAGQTEMAPRGEASQQPVVVPVMMPSGGQKQIVLQRDESGQLVGAVATEVQQ
jgi:hypothetical protein